VRLDEDDIPPSPSPNPSRFDFVMDGDIDFQEMRRLYVMSNQNQPLGPSREEDLKKDESSVRVK